ncbi:unnamed protein product [Psylliodes chrysocephalus]|uniref:Core Histone H2A/H2B/H3 domain-containing protein n=1 Tax=Psylliodes chrysocephalus TaxID=3402493 RepID=A0A9P0GLC0_9CUCU|nr:unnamed protein product [Psylliodes chrysocephala]
MVKRKSTPSKTPSKRSKQDSIPVPNSQSSSRSNQNESRRKQKIPMKKRVTTKVIMANKTFKVFRSTMREIKKLQSKTNLLIPKLPFSRLFREIMMECSTTVTRVQIEALRALQESAELYLTYLFQDANKCARHARRITVRPTDLHLVLEIRGEDMSNLGKIPY